MKKIVYQLLIVLIMPFVICSQAYAQSEEKKEIRVEVNDKSYQLLLENNEELNELASGDARYYKAKVINDDEAFARLSLIDGMWRGTIYLQNKFYTIKMPVSTQVNRRSINEVLQTNTLDMTQVKQHWCKDSDANTSLSSVTELSTMIGFDDKRANILHQRATTSNYFTLRLALDHYYLEKYSDVNNAKNMAINTVNQIDGIYLKAFNLHVKLTSINVMNSQEDSLSTTREAEALLSEVRTKSIFTDFTTGVTSQLLTGRSMQDGVAGIAYTDTFCGNYNYGLSQDIQESVFLIMAHEIGHTFGARHDTQTNYNIMYPSISGSDTFTQKSKDEMNRALTSACIYEEEQVEVAIKASFEATPIKGNAPLSVNLDATPSKASGSESITRYAWNRSDDVTINNGVKNTTLFQTEGTYSISLEILDSAGKKATISKQIEVLKALETVPNAVTELSIIELNNIAKLEWKDNSDNELTFVVYRSGVELVKLSKNSTSYSDTSVEKGQTYVYEVYAQNSEGLSLASNSVSITLSAQECKVEAIRNLQASNVTTNSFDVSWSSVNEATAYIVSRWNGNAWSENETANLSYSFTNITNNNEYVRVRARKSCGDGVESNYITVTMLVNEDNLNAQSSIIVSPVNEASLESGVTTFTKESGSGVNRSYLYVGLAKGSREIYSNYMSADSVDIDLTAYSGKKIYVRLWRYVSSSWKYIDYTYSVKENIDVALETKASILSPKEGVVLLSQDIIFARDKEATNNKYFLYVGNSVGDSAIYAGYFNEVEVSVNVSSASSELIYVRLWSFVNDAWSFRDYTYQKAIEEVGEDTQELEIPVASFEADRYSGTNREGGDLYVLLDANSSSPWNGKSKITRLEWSTNDTIIASDEIKIGLLLSGAGEHNITLSAYNSAGDKHSVSKIFFVGDNNETNSTDVSTDTTSSSSLQSSSSEVSSLSSSSQISSSSSVSSQSNDSNSSVSSVSSVASISSATSVSSISSSSSSQINSSSSESSQVSSSSSSATNAADAKNNSLDETKTALVLSSDNNFEFIAKNDVTFTFNSAIKGATQFTLQLGSDIGKKDILEAYSSSPTLLVNTIESDLDYIHVTAWYLVDSSWQYETYILQLQQENSVKVTEEIFSIDLAIDTQYAVIGKENLTFNFDTNKSGVERYALQLGSDFGKNEYFDDSTQNSSISVSVINAQNSSVYATAWYLINNTWEYEVFEYRVK